jgi:hypothetical protein
VFILKKKIFYRISRPISINLGTNHHWVRGIINCTNKRSFLQRGDNHKTAKSWLGNHIFPPENHWARMAHIYMKAFWHSADLCLYKLWSLRFRVWYIGGGGYFFICILERFQSSLVQTFLAWRKFKFIQIKVQVLFKGGIITKCKNRIESFKFFFSWSTVPYKIRFTWVLPYIV